MRILCKLVRSDLIASVRARAYEADRMLLNVTRGLFHLQPRVVGDAQLSVVSLAQPT